MKHNITAKNMDITDSVRFLVSKKLAPLDRLLKKFPSDLVSSNVVLEKHPRKEEYTAGIALLLPGKELVSHELGANIESAVVLATSALKEQIQKHKAKLRREFDYQREH